MQRRHSSAIKNAMPNRLTLRLFMWDGHCGPIGDGGAIGACHLWGYGSISGGLLSRRGCPGDGCRDPDRDSARAHPAYCSIPQERQRPLPPQQ